jgi:hypothetical protein
MGVQARFAVEQVERFGTAANQAAIMLRAAYNDGKGNEDWSRYTPSGTISLVVTNPPAIEWFEQRRGQVIAVGFDDVPAPPTS